MSDKLTIVQTDWHDEAEAMLKASFEDIYAMADLKADVENKRVALLNVYDENRAYIGVFALRLETTDVKEVVVCVAAGKIASGDLLPRIEPFIRGVALASGAKRLRAHTSKKGFVRYLESQSWKMHQYVLTKEIGG